MPDPGIPGEISGSLCKKMRNSPHTASFHFKQMYKLNQFHGNWFNLYTPLNRLAIYSHSKESFTKNIAHISGDSHFERSRRKDKFPPPKKSLFTMKDVSVLIPTAKRPHFLSTALESVARQTALDRIGEVLVIENGEDRGSGDVCKRFPNLPIKYIYRNPTIPASERTVSILREGSLPFVALLHDDDWWFDFHLERSLEKLGKEPSLPQHIQAT